jgi:transposase-like protein
MRRYSGTVKAEVKRRMGPPQRQSVAQNSQEFGINVATLYNWRHNWRLQGGSGGGIGERPRGLERCRQVHTRAGDRWIECH